MDNLYRSLAPISAAAWEQIDAEAKRTFIARIAGRRAVDMPDAAGTGLSAVPTGHVTQVDSPIAGVQTRQREVQPLVELRVPFEVSRSAIDDVERGSQDSDWQPVKEAVETLAAAEDTLVCTGSAASGVVGIIPSSTNATLQLPAEASELPDAIAKALTQLQSVGVEGPYALLLSSELYTIASESVDHGYPIAEHLRRLLGEDGDIVFAPALRGALLVSMRGGDYTLTLGQDVSIGYLSHDAETVRLYAQETLTFRVNTAEASVVLA